MATIVNTPGERESSGTGFLAGMIVLLVVVLLFLYFALPMFQRAGQTTVVPAPQGQGGGPAIQIPDKIDVNIDDNTTK